VDQNSFHSPRGFSYRWRLPSVNELRPGQRVEVYQGVLTGTVTATSRQPNSLNLAELELWVDGLDYTPILDGGRPQLIHFDMSYYNESGSEVHGATAVFSTHPMNSNLEQEPHPLSLELQAQSAAQE
jgi:hypothetical protein